MTITTLVYINCQLSIVNKLYGLQIVKKNKHYGITVISKRKNAFGINFMNSLYR